MATRTNERIQAQFGNKAAAYATSAVHAQGASLDRLLELVRPQPTWRTLDVATGAGHTALTFAPHVAAVIAADLTPAMLPMVAQLAQARSLVNLSYVVAGAETLPFAGNAFDLVTCRIAPHHFGDVAAFVREAARLLQPEGLLAVVDNVVPGEAGLRRRREREDARNVARYLNAFEKLRDPSHGRCLSQAEWRQLLEQNGFALLHEESDHKAIDFDDWVARMEVAPANVVRLRAMLRQAPSAVRAFLQPAYLGERITFHLTEAIFVGRLRKRAPPL
jgi:ubiquinone/menaquinone biosynthesis C-methylase UbiE